MGIEKGEAHLPHLAPLTRLPTCTPLHMVVPPFKYFSTFPNPLAHMCMAFSRCPTNEWTSMAFPSSGVHKVRHTRGVLGLGSGWEWREVDLVVLERSTMYSEVGKSRLQAVSYDPLFL